MKINSKQLYLPSGGVQYSPLAHIETLDYNFILTRLMGNYDTYFEMIVSIIQNYVKLPINIENLLIFDLIYIYTYINSLDIDQDIYLKKTINCICNKEHKVSVSLPNLSINFLNKYKDKGNELILKKNGTEIIFNYRKVIDNLTFISIQNDNDNYIDQIIKYVMTQIKEIKSIEGNIYNINESDYTDILYNLKLKDILYFYNSIFEFNKSFGIYDKFKMTCTCGKELVNWYYNDIQMCQPLILENNEGIIEKILKSAVEEGRLPGFNFYDFFNKPLKNDKNLLDIIRNTDYRAGTILS